MEVFRSTSKEALIEGFSENIIQALEGRLTNSEFVHMAVSGGSTPLAFFQLLSNKYQNSINWSKIHFWWVDERFVSHGHKENNFDNALKAGLRKLPVQLHRINTEKGSYSSLIKAYNKEVSKLLDHQNFDLVMLGAGEDGHTASLFPGDMSVITENANVVGTTNPHNKQLRIGLNFEPIINAENTYLLLSGENKKTIFDQLLEGQDVPINYVVQNAKNMQAYIDF